MNMKTIEEIRSEVLWQDEYRFIWKDIHLPILVGLGGSRAYGTQKEDGTSDIDVRGIALNTREEILLNRNYEQLLNEKTDTCIYSFNKIIKLLSDCNPNVIELLGLKPEHYLYVSSIGNELLSKRKMFLSKKCIHTFGGYAAAQMRRLDNEAVRLVSDVEREKHILNSIENAKYDFTQKYFQHRSDQIKLYIDKAINPEYETEIFMDVNLEHYPLRDYKSMWSEMQNIVKDYAKIGKRNRYAIDNGRLAKHMMHLIRLYLMAIDLLEKEEIITYRNQEHDLLMSIRHGDYLDDNAQPTSTFYELLDELEKRFEYAKKNTNLSEQPDYKAINEFVLDVNQRIVMDNIDE